MLAHAIQYLKVINLSGSFGASLVIARRERVTHPYQPIT